MCALIQGGELHLRCHFLQMVCCLEKRRQIFICSFALLKGQHRTIGQNDTIVGVLKKHVPPIVSRPNKQRLLHTDVEGRP